MTEDSRTPGPPRLDGFPGEKLEIPPGRPPGSDLDPEDSFAAKYHRARPPVPELTTSSPARNRKKVMVIYGHDQEANAALFDWLRSIGLQPREWDQLVHANQSASPYIGNILNQAFKEAQAVVAFFTPDERVRPRGHTKPWRLQARPNVLIEAGMALVSHPDRTILAVLGPQELPSDLAGRHYIRLSHASPEPLHRLAYQLQSANCDVDLSGTDWLNPARFPNRDNVTEHPADPIRSPAQTSKSFEADQPASTGDGRHFLALPPFDLRSEIESGGYEDVDLVLCCRTQLYAGFQGFRYITESARERVLDLLNNDADLTGANSDIISLLSRLHSGSFTTNKWHLHGPNSSRQLSARWRGFGPLPLRIWSYGSWCPVSGWW